MNTAIEQRIHHRPDNASVREAIRLAQQGDAEAFEFLYRRHCRRVYALCLRMVKETSEAEDLTQEVFLQLFRKIHLFRGESAFATWLHRLTVNRVLMHFRKKTLMSAPLEDTNANDDENAGCPHELATADLRLAGLFDRVDLQLAMDQLPKGYKTTFVLHDVEGYGHNEIAKRLGCSIGASKSQLHRARMRLRIVLHKLQHRTESRQLERVDVLTTDGTQVNCAAMLSLK